MHINDLCNISFLPCTQLSHQIHENIGRSAVASPFLLFFLLVSL
uniref:Uncharacterized protein n=1 Tax=Siphoviridae sp. ct0D87 TaxID=2827760 RepID=A0A8S5SAI5_9CAUD|nr:MAG TPA: hypothetical protein [Siphoviridae sp. ct0D87]